MNFRLIFLLFLSFNVSSCGTSKTIKKTEHSGIASQEHQEKNRGQLPLLTRIRQLPGVTLTNGVPVVTKASNSISSFGNAEPLYVLNGQIIGNSFVRVNDIVDNFNIKKVKVLTGSDANFYGTQGAKGVIEITTYK